MSHEHEPKKVHDKGSEEQEGQENLEEVVLEPSASASEGIDDGTPEPGH